LMVANGWRRTGWVNENDESLKTRPRPFAVLGDL
jgi:hypothetical protein